MDRTLAKKLKKHKKNKIKDRLKAVSKVKAEPGSSESKPPAAPAAPPNLEDVVDSEMAGEGSPQFASSAPVQVRKQEVPPPSAQPFSGGAQAVFQHMPRDPDQLPPPPADDDEDGDDEDVVTSNEVLQASSGAAVDRREKKRKGRSGGGGDYGAAYQEFYTQLCIRMLNRIYAYFKRLYVKCKSDKQFRKKLVDIQRWNQAEINRRAREILEVYPDTEALFRYAYAANVMLMSIIVQKDENSEDVEIEVPKFSVFIQKAYVESARVLFDNAGVLSPDIPDTDRLRIRQELYASFGRSVATALRLMVPLDSLAPKMEGAAEKYDDVPDDGSEAVDSDESGEDESEDEDSDSEDDDSEEDEDEDEEDSEDDDGSESGSEESESESEESEEEGEEEDYDGPPRKRVGMSKRSMRTPDRLSIDDRFD